MAVGKLKMKAVPGEASAGPSRKRRRRSRSPSDDARRPADRPIAGDGRASRGAAVVDDDGLVIDWTTTSPTLAAKLLSLDDDRAFRQKLFDALADDEPLDSLEAEYGFTVPSRWRNGTGTTYAHAGMARAGGVDAMEEEEYAEYMRRNMWRRTHRQEAVEMDARDRDVKRRERELKEARRKQKEDARRRAREAEDKARRRAERERRGHRDAYVTKWEALINGPAAAVRFSDIPWPVYPPSDGSALSAASLTPEAVSTFLLDQVSAASSPTADTSRAEAKVAAAAAVRDVLRAAVRSYHPDRFQRHAAKVEEGSGDRQRATEWGLKVSQLLNELLEREKLTSSTT